MTIYKRDGDSGQTGLLSGERVPKDHLRVKTYGSLDELQSLIGMARSLCRPQDIARDLYEVQKDLSAMSSELAAPSAQDRLKRRIGKPDVERLERCIDRTVEIYGLPSGFIVPGQGQDSAAIHVSRAVCRRCERLMVTLHRKEECRDVLLSYINRLGDMLFTLAWAVEVQSVVPNEPSAHPLKEEGRAGMNLTYPLAAILSHVAVAKAEALEVPMVVAFSEDSADLIFFGKMKGALPASSDIAINKSYTAASLRLPTDEIGRLAQQSQKLYGLQHAMGRNIVLFGGGLPLLVSGRVIGAVGISGGTVDEDISVAEAVQNALDQMVVLHDQLDPVLPEALRSPEQVCRFNRHLVVALEQAGVPLTTDWINVLTGAILMHSTGPSL